MDPHINPFKIRFEHQTLYYHTQNLAISYSTLFFFLTMRDPVTPDIFQQE